MIGKLHLRSRKSARAYAFAIAIAVWASVLIPAGFLTIGSAQTERARLEESARDKTREATAAVEHEIIAVQNALTILSTSPFLQNGDIEGFYNQAKEVSRRLGLQVALHDLQINQLANTAAPWATPGSAEHLPAIIDAYRRLEQTKQPVVSDVFFGPVVKQNIVAVEVPVFRGGDLAFVLGTGIPLERFHDILQSASGHAERTIGIVDRAGIIVTHLPNHDEYEGTHTRHPFAGDVPEVYEAVNREGIAFHGFARRSELLGWRVVTNVPDRVLEAPMKRAITNLIVWGVLLLAGGLMLADFLARGILQSAGKLGIDRKPTSEEFEILFNSSPNGEMVVDDRGRIVLLNAKAAEKFGYSQSELIGQAVEILVPERLREKHLGARQEFAGNLEAARSMGVGRELYARRKDGSEFPVEVGLNPIKSGRDNLVMITVVDITARKLAVEQLDAARIEREGLRRGLVHAQEQERLRMAHELHDQTGQTLAAAMLQIKSFEDSVNESDRARLRLLRAQLEQVGQTLHHVAWELRPASIDELGLESALANYLAEWSQRYGIESDFHCGELKTDALPEEKCTAIYRVIQEALTNVVKHAQGATQVSVVIERAGKNLGVTIEDNGCGFDTESLTGTKAGRSGGLGVAGMRERLTLFGGEFEIESSIGVGTTIFARIPLELEKDAA